MEPVSFLSQSISLIKWLYTVTATAFPKNIATFTDLVNDFWERASSGLLLCRLLYVLCPISIQYNKISKPKNIFSVRCNWELFYNSCVDFFRLNRNYLLTFDDIQERNFVKVIECLDDLSEIAQRSGLTKIEVKLEGVTKRVDEEEAGRLLQKFPHRKVAKNTTVLENVSRDIIKKMENTKQRTYTNKVPSACYLKPTPEQQQTHVELKSILRSQSFGPDNSSEIGTGLIQSQSIEQCTRKLNENEFVHDKIEKEDDQTKEIVDSKEESEVECYMRRSKTFACKETHTRSTAVETENLIISSLDAETKSKEAQSSRQGAIECVDEVNAKSQFATRLNDDTEIKKETTKKKSKRKERSTEPKDSSLDHPDSAKSMHSGSEITGSKITDHKSAKNSKKGKKHGRAHSFFEVKRCQKQKDKKITNLGINNPKNTATRKSCGNENNKLSNKKGSFTVIIPTVSDQSLNAPQRGNASACSAIPLDTAKFDLSQYNVEKVIFIQRRFRFHRLLKLRHLVATEIYTTEKTYVNYMHNMYDTYQAPLITAAQKGKPIIPQETIDQIFCNINGIIKVNESFLKQFEPMMESWNDNCCIAPIFITFSGVMKMYNQYYFGYDRASQILAELRKNKAWTTFCRDRVVLSDAGTVQPLESLLIMPVQRIPRYCLLLKELLKATPQDHCDYKATLEAKELYESLGNYVNARQKEGSEVYYVRFLNNVLYGNKTSLVDNPERRYIAKFIVYLKKSLEKKRFFIIFNDLCLLTQYTDAIETLKKPKLFVFEQWRLEETVFTPSLSNDGPAIYLTDPEAVKRLANKQSRHAGLRERDSSREGSNDVHPAERTLFFPERFTRDSVIELIRANKSAKGSEQLI